MEGKKKGASEWRYHSMRSLWVGREDMFQIQEGRRRKYFTLLFLTWGTTGRQEHGGMGESLLSVYSCVGGCELCFREHTMTSLGPASRIPVIRDEAGIRWARTSEGLTGGERL